MKNLSRRIFIKQSGVWATAVALPLSFNSFLNKKEMTNKKHFEVIIIGGSYSGLAAGMALGRALRHVLIIDNGKPCNRQTPHSHNFITQDGKTPKEIATLAKQQAEQSLFLIFKIEIGLKWKESPLYLKNNAVLFDNTRNFIL